MPYAERRNPGQPIGSYHRKRGAHGYDGAKRVNGRKRHLLVDTLGLLLRVVVHPANITDREGAELVLAGVKEQFPRLSLIWADLGYSGKRLADWVKETQNITLSITNRPRRWRWQSKNHPPLEDNKPAVQKRRWVVERTFAWEGRNRRLAKDYEGLPETEEALISMAMVRLMLKRLT